MSDQYQILVEEVKAKYTADQIREAVLDNVWNTCNEDGGYLENLIEWAHRDYTDADYLDDFITMDLQERR